MAPLPSRTCFRLARRKRDPVVLRRDVRSFFQGNRFLIEPLVRHLLDAVPDSPVVDLYAGVGLFGLSLAGRGHGVTLVEGDPVSGATSTQRQ
jgi:tRNA/tmRNA/rRNA uracil-C5-methylase (TrmA/RlmC/RlmD family)